MHCLRTPIFYYLNLLFIVSPSVLWAGFSFLDPEIPDGEIINYRSEREGEFSNIHEKVLIKKEGERKIYEIHSLSPELDAVLNVDKAAMTVLSVHTVRKYQDATFDSKFTVINEKENLDNDKIKLTHFIALKYLLRGYPFGKLNKLGISYYSQEKKKRFKMSVTYKKREQVKLKDKKIDCHKLEFGLGGFWGAFLPKLKYWYSVEPPHYLVRYEGSVGSPGSTEGIVELVDRTAPPEH